MNAQEARELAEQIKIELSFTMEEMEDFLLYNYPTNYHWKDRVKKDVMVWGNDNVVEDIKEEFVKCFKETLLSQRLNSRPSIYK
jgi:activator of HSP90 ATPase